MMLTERMQKIISNGVDGSGQSRGERAVRIVLLSALALLLL